MAELSLRCSESELPVAARVLVGPGLKRLEHVVDFFPKPFQRLADTLADLRQTAGSENDQDDDENNNEF